MKKICVYCGSSPGKDIAYVEAARSLAKNLADNDIELVYGGASVGVMGEVADTVLKFGGKVTGVIPQALVDKEVAHYGLTNLHIVDSMHERKALMADLSDGFVALPGGLGTLEELFEVLTWGQLGFHNKPCGLLNVNGFYDKLIAFLDFAMHEEFMKPIHRDLLLVESNPGTLLTALKSYQAPAIDKWIGRDQT